MVGMSDIYRTPSLGHTEMVAGNQKAIIKIILKNTAVLMFIICWSIFASVSAFPQPQHFANLSVSPKEVIAGQPFYVKITVYTPTWFTKAPDFGEYQVRNTFTLRTERPLGNYETIDGKRYTTLSYEYIVFPLKPGKLDLPPLNVEFESPVEGDYKGKHVNVTTKGASLKILPVPDFDDRYSLFVADNVSISESWNRTFSDLKVGDVLERTIRISANGTLANMIPPVAFDSLTWAGTYAGKASLSQTITGKNVSSERIDKQTYLLEEEGSYVIPEIQVNYYHLNSRKWLIKRIPGGEITIADNPDLYVLKTLQDSLTAGENMLVQGEKKSPEIFGLSLNKFLVLLALFCIAIVGLVCLLRAFFSWFRAYKTRYLQSERYQFRQLTQAVRRQNSKLINEYLYRWLGKLDPKKPFISVSEFAGSIDYSELTDSLNEFHKQEFGGSLKGEKIPSVPGITALLEKQLKSARRTWIQIKRKQEKFNINQYAY